MRAVNRREFLNAAATLVAAPVAAQAQQAGKVFHIGDLSAPTRESVEGILQAFRQALRVLGWVEGQNIVIEYRWADRDLDRLPRLAEDLVRRNVDVIVAPATSAALVAKRATGAIPIVMMFPTDPVAQGLVSSLRRPEGNVTGTTNIPIPDMLSKRLQILKEVVPDASRVAVVYDPVGRDRQRWRITSASRWPRTSRSTSVIHAVLGNAAATKTRTACSGSTCPRASTSRATHRPSSTR